MLNCTWMEEELFRNYIRPSKRLKINPSLVFDKYFFWEISQETPTFDKGGDKGFCKRKHFNHLKNLRSPLSTEQYNSLKIRKNYYNRSISFNLQTKTRLIINHGNESIFENSIALHPHYGFPIIPGSAIKGVTKHFCEEFAKLDEHTKKIIFGNSQNEGSIIFLDAWPISVGHQFFEIDVFTQHYKEYYQYNNKLPLDNEKTVPVNFLVVKKGINFEFAIAPSSMCRKKDVDERRLMSKTKTLVCRAMKTFGIGAKTGSNYGYFN